ncbi:MAG: hypothetical protein KME15_26350 [Drouetiella hepatica Uher 2000/2452]|jgi:hypothetical protein|uniref:Uncharacterized protein n=1 Tax=Drouetiella hepatica Uher 2000/2452 TaxID=904376 RepID=A0A951QGG4_9CYAN|nr:hypothetical protein [Drouetiella hepatica Uher 2000/2452]
MPRFRVTAKQLGDRHFIIHLSGKIAIVTQTLLRPGKNGRLARVKAAYFGFNSYDEAQSFAADIRRRFPACRMQVRQSQRLTTVWEVKVSHSCVEELAWQLLQKSPTVNDRIERHIALYAPKTQPVPTVIDRSTASLQGRSRPQMARCGDRMVSID